MLPLLLVLAAQAATVDVADGLTKVRPGDTAPFDARADLVALGNEFEAFQVVIGDATNVSVSAVIDAPLTVRLYRHGLYDVKTRSSGDGALGAWPDALIPDVDAFYGERRNAFPFDVPAGEVRSVRVEVFVPPGTAAGTYSGVVTVTAEGFEEAFPMTVDVRGVDLPSTASLPTAFGMGWDAACRAHLGGYEACGDAGVERFHALYARAALDHRISLSDVVYYGPDGADWSRFDGVYAPLMDGTAETTLVGAKQTSVRLMTSDPAEMALWRDHFASKGWSGLFDYTCDEPPAGCAWSDIPERAAIVHAAGLRTLVTTDVDEMNERDLADDIDILVPVVNYVDDKGGPDRRPDYDAFLADSGKSLWWYQSCMSHGCGDGETTDPYFTGWPSMMIDASGVQNRAMEWLSFRYRISGELYFATDYALDTAWTDQFFFGGNGDGTLFYPGRPDVIGGTTDIPVTSLRLAAIRDGMEDYEVLATLRARGGDDAAFADQVAAELFPEPSSAGDVGSEALLEARLRLIDRLAPAGPPGPDTDDPSDTDRPPLDGEAKGCGGCATGGSSGAWVSILAMVMIARNIRRNVDSRGSTCR